MRGARARLFDVRQNERGVVLIFGALVLALVAAHTVLETARDTLLLMKLSPRWLNFASVVTALLTFPVAGTVARTTRRIGTRQTLLLGLGLTVSALAVAAAVPVSRIVVLGLSIFAPLAGGVMLSQFWVLAGVSFSVSQSRRLFGLLAAAGVLGAVLGAGLSVLVLRVAPPRSLLVLSAVLFALATVGATRVRAPHSSPVPVPLSEMLSSSHEVRREPLLRRLAVLVIAATMVFVVVDYLFKATAAQRLAPEQLGPFFARFYLVTNALSLVVQVFVTPRVLRQLGVIGAVAITPFLLLGGGLVVALTGTLPAVMLTKVVDGSLRYSLHRVSSELLALPLPPEARAEGKVWVDTVLPRLAQALAAGGLLLVAMRVALSTHLLGVGLGVLAALWLLAAVSTRNLYLDAFRTSLADGFEEGTNLASLDIDAAAVLVEGLASRDDGRVLAAMDLLAHHGQERLVSALILHHESEPVLLRALRGFGASARSDWIPLAEGLLQNASEPVRLGALSALVRHGRVDALEVAAADASPTVRAYATYQQALRGHAADVFDDPAVRRILAQDVPARRALLAAAADDPQERAAGLLLHFAHDGEVLRGPDSAADLAHAMERVADPRFLPTLVQRLGARVGREAVVEALVHLGEPAFEALADALVNSQDRHVRLHVPRALGRFGTQAACDVLTARLGTETEGVVRYKILRGLGLFVGTEVRFDGVRLAAACRDILRERIRLAGLRPVLDGLLASLVDDKLEQSLERVFRLLKMMHPEHDVHRLHRASTGTDPKERARVLEYLDAMLVSDAERPLRPLLRLVLDEAPQRATVTRAAALAELVTDRDRVLAKLAAAVEKESVDAKPPGDPTAPDRQPVSRPLARPADVGDPAAHEADP